MQAIAVPGLGRGKTGRSAAGMVSDGRVVLRRRVARDGLPALLGKPAPGVVALEA